MFSSDGRRCDARAWQYIGMQCKPAQHSSLHLMPVPGDLAALGIHMQGGSTFAWPVAGRAACEHLAVKTTNGNKPQTRAQPPSPNSRRARMTLGTPEQIIEMYIRLQCCWKPEQQIRLGLQRQIRSHVQLIRAYAYTRALRGSAPNVLSNQSSQNAENSSSGMEGR